MENRYRNLNTQNSTRRRIAAARIVRIFTLVLLTVLLPMCREKELAEPAASQMPVASKERQNQLKRLFGKALVRVLADEQGTRQLIKTEALKQFNHDYDVLYHMVKNQPVRDGLTFRQAIQRALPSEATAGTPAARTLPLLEEIERELPLLTIMVPELPQNSFSAEKWDVATEIPIVALRIWAEQGVPYVACNGEEDYIPYNYTPGFPVVVVKDNERVTTSRQPSELTFKTPNTDFYFQFTDRNFVNIAERKKNKSGRWTSDLDIKLIQAKTL